MGRIYEYGVHDCHDYTNTFFVNASNYKNAIKRAFKEWFDQKNSFHVNKRDLRATRVTK